MIGFGGHESGQLVQVVVGGRQDRAVVAGADPEHQSFAVGIEQPQPTRRLKPATLAWLAH